MHCYCGSPYSFDDCCQPIIDGRKSAVSAEALMRSRYSAYVVADINYLMNSHHPRTRPVKQRKSILRWTRSVKWLRLDIICTRAGQAHDEEGWVEFKAFFIDGGTMDSIHENSYFNRVNGRWVYVSGEHH